MLTASLEKTGLSAREAAVYLALLESGKVTAQVLSKKTKLPRSTVYSILDYLEQKQLAIPQDEKKIRHFTAGDPGKIAEDLRGRTAAMAAILPDLKELFLTAKITPRVRFYAGKENIREMYDGIIKEAGLKSYDIIASEEAWLGMDPKFFEDFKKRRALAGIHTRLILEDSPASRGRKLAERPTHSEVKIAPAAVTGPFTGGCYIFKSKVIFLAYQKEHVACEIYSQEIAGLLQMIFNFMWRFLGE